MTTPNQPQRIVPNGLFFAEVEENLAQGRSVIIPLKGYSMRPFLRNQRDNVVLTPIGERELRRGMVLLFRYRGAHILHRYRGTVEGKLRMVGDGNYRLEERVERKDVVALLTRVERGGRGFDYGSCEWRVRSVWSLGVRLLRCVALWTKHKIWK